MIERLSEIFSEIKLAYKIVEEVVKNTSIMRSKTLEALTQAKGIYIKCENFQRTGSFKFRGAWNAISHLSKDKKKKGVIAHSSGNHAQAVALAAKILGIKAVIVMPENTSEFKKKATENYGAEIIYSGNKPKDRAIMAENLAEERELSLIHPHNDYQIIFGAGTVAYELLREIGKLDLILAPVGGGGLISGTAIAAKGLLPNIQVIGVEPQNADDAYRSFKSGTRLLVENPDTIADGLRTSLGENTFPIIQEHVDDIITVSEEQIFKSMMFYLERMKIVAEPSGAVSLAPLLFNLLKKNLVKNKRIGVILSGGNVDLLEFFSNFKSSDIKS
ncbi:MAG: threonine/serine dehydratase [Promethearchaeota archaeon]|nr:MAG: threonine/serine dehydratase [Candidatus Lokiarchaeota archaeon]